MKVAYLTGKYKIEIREKLEPALVNSNDVLVKIEAVGICGSDIHYFKDGRIGSQIMEYPATIGHECTGTVVEIGAAVKKLTVGQRVAIDPAIACGLCDQCLANRSHTCRNLKFMGNPGEALGAFSELVILPAKNCYPIPETMALNEAVFVEPLSIGIYAASLAGDVLGKSMAVLGTGPIGLSTLISLNLQLPERLFATDLFKNRLAAATNLGAYWTGVPTEQNIVTDILKLEPLGLDYVFECAGQQETLDQAIDLLKPGGTLVIVGIPEGNSVTLSIDKLRRKEQRILNVRRQNDCVQAAINLIATRQANVAPLVTHHFSFEDIEAAFKLVVAYQDNVIKAIIHLS